MADEVDPCPSWPGWVKGMVSAGLVVHLVAVLALALGQPPASGLERNLANQFAHYHELIGQEGHGYRFYAPAPPPTPIVTARLRMADGSVREVRLPDRSARPRLRYQRQLALAHHLYVESLAAREAPDASPSAWAASYARHLCRTTPGCSGVSLSVQLHHLPDPHQLSELAERPGAAAIDLEDDAFYSVPERIGDFPCADR